MGTEIQLPGTPATTVVIIRSRDTVARYHSNYSRVIIGYRDTVDRYRSNYSCHNWVQRYSWPGFASTKVES